MAEEPQRIALRPEYLSFVRAGQKTVEGRLARPAYRSITAGQTLRFYSDADADVDAAPVDVVVESVTLHATFRDMLEAYGVAAFLPAWEAGDLDGAVELYRGFPGYRDGEGTWGACAIKVVVGR